MKLHYIYDLLKNTIETRYKRCTTFPRSNENSYLNKKGDILSSLIHKIKRDSIRLFFYSLEVEGCFIKKGRKRIIQSGVSRRFN